MEIEDSGGSGESSNVLLSVLGLRVDPLGEVEDF